MNGRPGDEQFDTNVWAVPGQITAVVAWPLGTLYLAVYGTRYGRTRKVSC